MSLKLTLSLGLSQKGKTLPSATPEVELSDDDDTTVLADDDGITLLTDD